MNRDIDYHLERAQTERSIADRCESAAVADAHSKLSELHLQRALDLQHLRHAPLGNVTPLRPIEQFSTSVAAAAAG